MFDWLDTVFLQPSTLLVALIVFVVAYIYMRSGQKKFLPGPVSLPLIGTILSQPPLMQPEDLCKLADKYGDIFMLNMFSKKAVFLNSYEAIKEATITKPLDFADRQVGHDFMNIIINPKIGGVIIRDFDEKGRKVRSMSLSIMRNLGVGRSTMEQKILEEAETLVSIFESTNGNAFDPWHKVTSCVTNVILHIILNKRHEYADQELQQLIRDADRFIQEMRFIPLFDPFPALRFIPPFKKNFHAYIKSNQSVIDYLWKYTKPLISSFQPGHDSHFVDAYLDKTYDEKSGQNTIDEDEFQYLLRDFLLAGIETTTTSLKWTLLHLANRPEIQEKLQAELDRVVGRDRLYSLKDKVPYLDAVIWEVQRVSSIVPLAIPHAVSTKKEAMLKEYVIPKDALIMLNLFAVHNDKSTWGDPENFRPERFLDHKGEFVKHSHVIPFSIGKRSCLGELLARQELYIFTAALFQRFKFRPDDGINEIDPTPGLAFTRLPKPFQLKAISRY